MAKVAFVGLGVMGYPMAGHLNKTRTKADEQAYKDALNRIPVSNEKPDPWKSVR